MAKFLRIAFLCNTSGGYFWQCYHGTVKLAGVPALWFCTSTCFQFWSKTLKIFYYQVTKQFLPWSQQLVLCFQFQNMFWENINSFWFWWKTYRSCCTNNYVISHVKRLSSPALCSSSGAFNFEVWFGKRKNAMWAKILH